MDNMFLRWWGCGAFEIIMGDVNIAVDPYLFGENLEKAEPIFDYIFISHEHFDHCHPPTLQKLCKGDRFKKIFVNIGCLTPNEPIDKNYGDAAFARDLPINKHIPAEMIQVIYPKYLSDDERSFPGPFEADLEPISVEAVESGENSRPDLPTCGYMITHTEKNVSFYHMGDLTKNFPALENLKGRVDFLVHMKLGTLMKPGRGGGIWDVMSDFIDLVQPRFFIPTHYRTDSTSDPIPHGHWPPNLTDTNAYFEDLRDHIGDRTRILPFTAGVQYEVEMPSKKVKWAWDFFNTWDVPPWRG